MLVQVQVMLDESDVFKLVVRLQTENDTPLVHQQVLELDGNVDKSFVKLLHPNMIEFKDIHGVASAELLAKTAAEAKAKEEAESAPAVVDGEVIVEA